MPRSNRRDPRYGAPQPRGGPRGSAEGGSDLSWVLGGHHRREAGPDGEWNVREVGPGRSDKFYRCPGCDQVLTPGTPHVVAWPTQHLFGDEHAAGERRHWHRSCWAARARRRPR